MSLPRYPNYKDSGVEWLGEVPRHWEVAPFKTQIDRNDGGVWGDDPDGTNDTFVLRSTEQTVDGRWRMDDPAPRKLSESDIKSALLIEGDLLLTKSSGSSLHIGKTTLVSKEIGEMRCCYSNFMQRIRTKTSFMPELAWFVLNNDLARLQFDLLSNSTTGLANLNGTMIGQIVIPVPPLPEQTQIAAFLDRETAKIDELVAQQRRLTALLKEKRQAVISHAVTRGLNPHAPLKPSGIEWLGDVPEHWVQSRLKYNVRGLIDTEHKTAPFFDDGEYLVVRTTNIKDGKLLLEGGKYTNAGGFEEWTRRAIPKPGDIMFTREAPAGEACLVPENIRLCMGQRTVLMQIEPLVLDSNFALWSLYGGLASEFVSVLSQGSTVVHFNMSDIRNIPIMLPPTQEQVEIAEFLAQELARFDTLTTEAQRAIDLLQERRTALISAAVTGQIDVRSTVVA